MGTLKYMPKYCNFAITRRFRCYHCCTITNAKPYRYGKTYKIYRNTLCRCQQYAKYKKKRIELE